MAGIKGWTAWEVGDDALKASCNGHLHAQWWGGGRRGPGWIRHSLQLTTTVPRFEGVGAAGGELSGSSFRLLECSLIAVLLWHGLRRRQCGPPTHAPRRASSRPLMSREDCMISCRNQSSVKIVSPVKIAGSVHA